jgi:hypothetical protein
LRPLKGLVVITVVTAVVSNREVIDGPETAVQAR